ncbi:ERI1 exoribonuclease 3-like isoform X2 [Anneissia japonica]|uniref:ERI1 exoribonuclease 3-like isoform X1 n=1 Tax=Anneissia japonica TaxID=1529436 RepID=UPI0014255136|nr:ERI1 exoribonuclease 3-like isoform X1 [Anneissia japonica]XP_033107309.1 ERI1 exoribonuclease 3-like isoform X2 [Anneissia japonica]
MRRRLRFIVQQLITYSRTRIDNHSSRPNIQNCQSINSIHTSCEKHRNSPLSARTTPSVVGSNVHIITAISSIRPFITMASKSSPGKSNFAKQKFDYFLVLDFEATCEDMQRIHPQEIIELPVIKVSGKTFETEAEFHTYVQPTAHPQLSTFCTELTGITQSMVDGQPTFQESLKMLDAWMVKEDLLRDNNSFIFVTCGDWDFKKQLTHQCEYTGIEFPHYCKQWINIKKAFAAATGIYPKGMPNMLNHLKLTLDGRHHSGIDDSRNIAKILREIGRKGFIFEATGNL